MIINVSSPGNVVETILAITFVKLLFSRNYHNYKNSVKHPRWSLFANIVRLKAYMNYIPAYMNYIPVNTIS